MDIVIYVLRLTSKDTMLILGALLDHISNCNLKTFPNVEGNGRGGHSHISNP